MGEHGTWETVYELPSDICYGISGGYVPRRVLSDLRKRKGLEVSL